MKKSILPFAFAAMFLVMCSCSHNSGSPQTAENTLTDTSSFDTVVNDTSKLHLVPLTVATDDSIRYVTFIRAKLGFLPYQYVKVHVADLLDCMGLLNKKNIKLNAKKRLGVKMFNGWDGIKPGKNDTVNHFHVYFQPVRYNANRTIIDSTLYFNKSGQVVASNGKPVNGKKDTLYVADLNNPCPPCSP